MDDDSNSGFELLSSQPEAKTSYDKVPETTVFKFKICAEHTARKISYRLKQGTHLPYTTHVGGKTELLIKIQISYF